MPVVHPQPLCLLRMCGANKASFSRAVGARETVSVITETTGNLMSKEYGEKERGLRGKCLLSGRSKCCCCRNKILTPGTARTSGVDELHFPMWKELTSNQNQWRNQLRGNMAAATDRPIRTSSQFWVPLIPGYLLRMRSHEVCCGRAPHPFCCTGKYRQKSQHGLYGHIDCSSYVASQPGYQSMY